MRQMCPWCGSGSAWSMHRRRGTTGLGPFVGQKSPAKNLRVDGIPPTNGPPVKPEGGLYIMKFTSDALIRPSLTGGEGTLRGWAP